MQIRAFRRTEPTTVELFGVFLNFTVNTHGHVVCDVTDDPSIERLLSIKDAYCIYEPLAASREPAPVPVPPAASTVVPPVAAPAPAPAPDADVNTDDELDQPDPDAVLKGSDILPETIVISPLLTVPVAQVIEGAFATSGLNREEWNLNDDDDREMLLDNELQRLTRLEEAKALDAQRVAEQTQADQAAEGANNDAVDPLVITSEDGSQTIDLKTFSATKLREFAAANKIDLPAGNSTKVGELRLLVAKALTGAKD